MSIGISYNEAKEYLIKIYSETYDIPNHTDIITYMQEYNIRSFRK